MKQLKEKEYEEFRQYLYNKTHGYIWTPDTLELICGGNDNEPERIGKQVLEIADVDVADGAAAHDGGADLLNVHGVSTPFAGVHLLYN